MRTNRKDREWEEKLQERKDMADGGGGGWDGGADI